MQLLSLMRGHTSPSFTKTRKFPRTWGFITRLVVEVCNLLVFNSSCHTYLIHLITRQIWQSSFWCSTLANKLFTSFASSHDRSDNKLGYIFYPGGHVDYRAYAPLMRGNNSIISSTTTTFHTMHDRLLCANMQSLVVNPHWWNFIWWQASQVIEYIVCSEGT